ncbi:MAG: AAA family ATPase, partial [Kiritimatiellae bacterium]|nr:AAA family ATPase [Kiritimatiellia bacterium]
MKDNLQIPYGVADFKTLRRDRLYYIDKTGFIPTLEQAGRFLFFVLPRRFGKSLMASMLRCYYDCAEKDNFDKLFGGLDIAKNPTENKSRYQVLALDFSCVIPSPNATLQQRFEEYLGVCLDVFAMKYESGYGKGFADSVKGLSTQAKFSKIAETAKANGFPLYLLLDEYDNFTNQMLRAEGNEPYRDITHGQGFYRSWFKLFKAAFDRIYMTGVSPVTMDDLTSGFNIATNISQDARFNTMLGFSEADVLQLYTDFKGTGRYSEGEPADYVRLIKPWYDGYCFSTRKIGKESV